MKRNGGILLVGAMVVTGACEVALHWLLGKGTLPRLLAIYFAADYPSGRHDFAGTLDNIVPAVILGWVNGWVGFSRWSRRKLIVTTVVLAMFIASLVPAYSALVGPDRFAIVWGMPKSAFQAALSHLYDVLGAFLTSGFFTYAAYVFCDWKRRKSE